MNVRRDTRANGADELLIKVKQQRVPARINPQLYWQHPVNA
jgi:hypothetical protein